MGKLTDAERVFSDELNKIKDTANLRIGIRNGSIVILDKGKIHQELTNSLIKAIGRKGDKAKFNYLRSIPIQANRGVIPKKYTSKGQREAGQLSNALGRYFEYLVFIRLQEVSKRDLKADSNAMTSEESQELSNLLGQKKYLTTIQKIAPELVSIVESCAESAVEDLLNNDEAGLTLDDLKADILYALAGSNPQGDIKLGNGPSLELKFSQSGDRIKYFTLNDLEHFGNTGLMKFSKTIVDKSSDVWRSDDETSKPTNAWVTGIRTIAFQEYVSLYLTKMAQSSYGNQSKALLKYLLSKGEGTSKLNKKILLQIGKVKPGSYSMTIDLDSYLDQLDSISANGIGKDDSVRAEVRFESQSRGHLATLTTETESIAKYSSERLNGKTIPVEEQSATFLFFLQKDFYMK